MTPKYIEFGNPHDWEIFLQRHPVFAEKMQAIFGTFEKIFLRELQSETSADRVIFYLGRICIEDFMEILLLCGNGHGIGGLKLLRGLYERAVTLAYIAKYPEMADKFLGYHAIHKWRLFNHASKVLDMKKLLPSDEIESIKKSYEETKENYQEVLCEKCGKKRVRISWSNLDLASMASKVGLEKQYMQCYFQPTLQSHPTVSSLTQRLKVRSDGHIGFESGPQQEQIDFALNGAHFMILSVIDDENRYFKMNLDEEIQDRFKDYVEIVKKSERIACPKDAG